MGIKGYKVFNSDWTCRGFQYEVGKTYKHNGNIEMCGSGFHFCQKAADCFNYYNFDPNNKVAEVEAIGLVETRDDKSVTDEIVIIREISWQKLLTLVNTGNWCTGLKNSGNWNSGNRNSGNCNSGYFNTATPKVTIFNKQTDTTFEDFSKIKGIQVLNWNYENNWWVYSQNMTKEEKKAHPEHETMGGYLKTVDFKTACKMMWDNLDNEDKQSVKEIPNFDPDVFKEITGIDVNE